MNQSNKKERGFITTILLIIIALALLKYFLNWDIFDAAASDEGRTTISYIKDVIDTAWAVIETPVRFAWDEVVKPIFSFAFDALKGMLEEGRESLNEQQS